MKFLRLFLGSAVFVTAFGLSIRAVSCFDDVGVRQCTTVVCLCGNSHTQSDCEASGGGMLKCTVLGQYYEFGISPGTAYMIDPNGNMSGCGTILTATSTCTWDGTRCKCTNTNPVWTNSQTMCSNAHAVICQ